MNMCGSVENVVYQVTKHLDERFNVQHNWNGYCLTWRISSRLKQAQADSRIIKKW